MSDPNIIDPEYNEFLKVFDGCWPTNYEFFLAACNWQKQKQEKAQNSPNYSLGEPAAVVAVDKSNMLKFYLDANGVSHQWQDKDAAYIQPLRELEVGTPLYTSAPSIRNRNDTTRTCIS